MPIPSVNSNESENEYVSRCMGEIGGEYDDNAQAVAICYATYEKENMSKSKFSEYRIKTQMQIVALNNSGQINTIKVIKNIYHTNKLKGFYVGIHQHLTREQLDLLVKGLNEEL